MQPDRDLFLWGCLACSITIILSVSLIVFLLGLLF
jgi:hypothetical protein